MNGIMFLMLATVFSGVSILLTEAVKRAFQNAEKPYSANLIALIDAVVVGIGGTAAAYILLGIAFTLPNIVCLILMGVAVWVGSMVGYDKVIQLITQIVATKKSK